LTRKIIELRPMFLALALSQGVSSPLKSLYTSVILNIHRSKT